MCNRYQGPPEPTALMAAFNIPKHPDTGRLPEPELFPKRDAWVVRRDGNLILDLMQWGFPPPAQSRAPVTNVRNLSSPFWRSALFTPSRRCLVPFQSFCEWEGEKGSKVARWFSVPSQELSAFAGIWRPVEDGRAFAFLTCEPNVMVGAVHPKAMPVVLHPEDYGRWLDGTLDDILPLAAPFPSQLMTMI